MQLCSGSVFLIIDVFKYLHICFPYLLFPECFHNYWGFHRVEGFFIIHENSAYWWLDELTKLGNYRPYTSARVNERVLLLSPRNCREPGSNPQPLGHEPSTVLGIEPPAPCAMHSGFVYSACFSTNWLMTWMYCLLHCIVLLKKNTPKSCLVLRLIWLKRTTNSIHKLYC